MVEVVRWYLSSISASKKVHLTQLMSLAIICGDLVPIVENFFDITVHVRGITIILTAVKADNKVYFPTNFQLHAFVHVHV